MRWWDVETGRQLRLLEVKNSPICVAISRDDRHSLSGGEDMIGRVWELETGAELQRLEGHTGRIWHVAMSPDGQMGLTAGKDKIILLWNLRTGKLVRRFQGHESDVNNLVFSPDGRRFLSASDDATIRLWEVETGRELGRWTGHAGGVGAVAISPGGGLVLTGGVTPASASGGCRSRRPEAWDHVVLDRRVHPPVLRPHPRRFRSSDPARLMRDCPLRGDSPVAA